MIRPYLDVLTALAGVAAASALGYLMAVLARRPLASRLSRETTS